MRVSAKGEYALLALFELARDYNSDGVLTIDQIAHLQDIPHPFLVQILQDLKKAGLVESQRGAGGGYRLAFHPKDISVGKVVRLIDGPILPFKCSLASDRPTCPRHESCPISYIWDDLRGAIEKVLDKTTFDDVLHGRHCPDFRFPS
ncbi:MAG: Rrf2 family transcriptional regulator [bacterium]